MIKTGFPRYQDTLSDATVADWQTLVFGYVKPLSIGQIIHNALDQFLSPLYCLADARNGYVWVTSSAATGAEMAALVPDYSTGQSATIKPTAGQSGVSLRWEIVHDPFHLWGGVFDEFCYPQLAKRSAWGCIDAVLPRMTSPMALLDQQAGTLAFWDDYNALPSITPNETTVCVRLFETIGDRALIFEGGAT